MEHWLCRFITRRLMSLKTAEAMEAAFCGRTADHAYSRITNPTVQHFENCIRSVTGL